MTGVMSGKIELVDVQDRHLLLTSVSSKMRPLNANSWARVKRGKYRGDLALVTDVDNETLVCGVLLVPRIDMTTHRKRKRSFRPAQALFDADKIQEIFGVDSVERRNRMVVFMGQTYMGGCLSKDVHMTGLSSEGVNATAKELDFFRGCEGHWDTASKHISPIKSGDRVRVIRGAYIGTLGEITEVLDMTVKVFNREKDEVIEIPTPDVRRAFTLADYVKVTHGLNRGIEGFVVALDDHCVSIFSLPSEDDLEGKEVSEFNCALPI